jgi:hypothetical protein
MRENVLKMSEHAKERTKSQANIRTVLHDPFLNQPKSPKPEPEPTKEPTSAQSVTQIQTSSLHLPGLGMPLRGFPTTLAPSVVMPLDAVSVASENNLRDSSPDCEWQRKPAETYDVTAVAFPSGQSSIHKWDPRKLDEWWWSGTKFARHEELFQSIKACDNTPAARIEPIGGEDSSNEPAHNEKMTRLLVPVLENLAAYVQGPQDKRRDYFSQWVKAPEWAIDRSPNGNDSFFDSSWGQPPARVGRDPRYRAMPDMRFGSFEGNVVSGLDRRFAFGGVGRY